MAPKSAKGISRERTQRTHSQARDTKVAFLKNGKEISFDKNDYGCKLIGR
jgi:hypothetical protein